MSKRRTVHNPTDIRFEYGADKFKEIQELTSSYITEQPELLLLLGLFGYKNNSKINLDTKANGDEEHTISRTVYQRSETYTESSMGLMTILDNLNEDYSNIINNVAFAKMTDQGLSFTKLPNVQTFYSYMLGGIEPFYEEIFEYGKSDESIGRKLYDMVMEDDDDVEKLINDLNFELEFGDNQE